MSNLLKNTSLSINAADKIISDTLHKCDDGELYLEDTKFETVNLDDNKIKSSDYSTDTGYGFRAVTDDVIAYSHSNEISEESLKKSSENLIKKIKNEIRTNASPRHVPSKIIKVSDIPRTKNGKIVELAVKNIIEGNKIKNIQALANPEVLKEYKNLDELKT